MTLRGMHDSDFPILNALYKKYYSEFENPEFHDNYFTKFVIEDSDKSILLGGGLRSQAEVVLVTDKSKNIHSLGEALIKALKHSVMSSRIRHIDFLTAYVQDEGYKKHLIDHGFDPIKGSPLSLYLGRK